MVPIQNNLQYRRDIDGLRAVAVLSVVLFHAGFGVPGGFVGVDVFFVISGYLITSLLWKDLASGRFTFGNFWERRARRIAPALIVVTLATLAAGYFILLPFDLLNLGKAAASQAVFAANFFYWLASGYFAGEASEKPLLHTWSLAVEEQFYLIAPVLLWAIHRSKMLRRPGAVCSLVAIGFVLSLGVSIYSVAHYRDAAFYLLPSRAWELLIGSLVALLPASFVPRRRFAREALSLLGLGMILYAIFGYAKDTPFPGLAALLPCLGTAGLIGANSLKDRPMSLIGTLLSARPLVFIGLISYSLYLWHWPFLAFAKYSEVAPLSVGPRLALLAAGFVCAVLSWRFVETPFRQRQVSPGSGSMFVTAGAGLAITLAAGLLYISFHGFPKRFSAAQRHSADARLDSDFLPDLSSQNVIQEKLFSIGATDPALPPTVFLWGDSHAKAILPALDPLLKSENVAGRAALRSSTAPVLGWSKPTSLIGPEIIAYNDAVFSYIQSHHISTVVLAAMWFSNSRLPSASPAQSFDAALLATIRKLHAAGCRTWLILDVPYQYFDVPRAVSRPIYRRSYIDSLCTRVANTDPLDWIDQRVMAQIKAEGTRILDPKPLFLDPTGQFYFVQSGTTVLYCDHDHLTRAGARKLLQPFLENSFDPGPPPKLP